MHILLAAVRWMSDVRRELWSWGKTEISAPMSIRKNLLERRSFICTRVELGLIRGCPVDMPGSSEISHNLRDSTNKLSQTSATPGVQHPWFYIDLIQDMVVWFWEAWACLSQTKIGFFNTKLVIGVSWHGSRHVPTKILSSTWWTRQYTASLRIQDSGAANLLSLDSHGNHMDAKNKGK